MLANEDPRALRYLTLVLLLAQEFIHFLDLEGILENLGKLLLSNCSPLWHFHID
jgi:hypothetical protein